VARPGHEPPSGTAEGDAQREIRALRERVAALERAVRGGQDAFFQALDCTPVGAFVLSVAEELRVLHVNPEFTRLTGYAIEDMPTFGAWARRAFPDEAYRAEVLAQWTQDLNPEDRREAVFNVTARSGAVRRMLFRSGTIAADRVVVLAIDVTRRFRAEQALRESEGRYRGVVENAPFGILIHTGGRVLFCNEAATRMAQVDASEAIGANVADFLHPDDRPRALQRIRRSYETGEVQPPILERLLRPDGTTLPVEVTSAPARFQGQPASQVIFVDVTERLRAERARRELDARVQHAQKMESLAMLAGGVAHDFNNLLMGILGNAELLSLDIPEDSPLQPLLKDISVGAERAADLARQMLAYSGRGERVVEPIDLVALVGEIGRLLGAAVPKGVTRKFDLSASTPRVLGDATQLRQVVMNLVTNAADALGDGPGTVTIRTGAVDADAELLSHAYLDDGLSPGRYAFFEVQDTGPGITPEAMRRIFDPFFTTKSTGRGLGLAAVLGIVRAHGGAIIVDSGRRRGTRFQVLLPELDGTADGTPAPLWGGAGAEGEGAVESTTEGGGSAADAAYPANAGDDQVSPDPPLVLLVDDEATVLDVASRLVERLGLRVVAVGSGDEAAALVEASPSRFRAAVVDLHMPGLSGLDTLAALRRLAPSLRLVVSSGSSREDLAELVRTGAVDACLQKPFRLGRMRQALERLELL